MPHRRPPRVGVGLDGWERRSAVKYSEARLGRVLVVRLEDGDVVHESIEGAARSAGIERAAVILLGGAGKGSRLVVGPKDAAAAPVVPLERVLHDVHEAAGVGTIFPDDAGRPVLHLHAAFGRDDQAVAGCIRRGVVTWVVGEAIVIELVASGARRAHDAERGFEVLEP
jgi:predicted DNA-binding protein with PD1-like motif